MDVHSKDQRSYNMSRIKGKDTKPEILVRKWLSSNGFRYRLHRKDLPGKPDIAFIKLKKAIFIHGCFWHRHNCRYFKWPQTNPEFWKKKINESAARDQKKYAELTALGWKYFIIWECELKSNSVEIFKRVKSFIESKS